MVEEKQYSTGITESKSWFEEWFDSDYYHILYKERDEEEAKLFLNNLKKITGWQPGQTILDLACGRGRHAHYLASSGLLVTGLDLSVSSIAYAKKSSQNSVAFKVHDMRQPFGVQQFDYILNLFTSFGYFDNEEENILVLQHIANALKNDGIAVIEYMNPHYVIEHLKEKETKQVEDIVFEMSKEVTGNFLYKHIRFIADKQEHLFTERVMLIYLQQFQKYFEVVGLKLQHLYGNYNLSPYEAANSPRMILVMKKENSITKTNA